VFRAGTCTFPEADARDRQLRVILAHSTVAPDITTPMTASGGFVGPLPAKSGPSSIELRCPGADVRINRFGILQ
jgi:hypothetical protein